MSIPRTESHDEKNAETDSGLSPPSATEQIDPKNAYLCLKKNGKTPAEKGHGRGGGYVRDIRRPRAHAEKGGNLGILTGRRSLNHFVVDVDPKHGGDETLEALEAEHGELPRTNVVRTPSGGRHILLSSASLDFEFTQDCQGKVLGTGIDVKCEYGYRLAPGSEINGASYVQEAGGAAGPYDDPPEWLVEKLREHFVDKASSRSDDKPAVGEKREAPEKVAHPGDCCEKVAADAMQSVADKMDRLAKKGERKRIKINGEEHGWDSGFWLLACRLVEIAEWPYTSLTLEDAGDVFFAHAPKAQGSYDPAHKWARGEADAERWRRGEDHRLCAHTVRLLHKSTGEEFTEAEYAEAAMAEVVAEAERITQESAEAGSGETRGTSTKPDKRPLAVKLRDEVSEKYDLFPAEGDGRVYAAPKGGGRAEILTPAFVLRSTTEGRDQASLPREAGNAADFLRMNHGNDKRQRLSFRVHHERDRIVLDLAHPQNSRCVVVTAVRWTVEDSPPEGVRFAAPRPDTELPEPDRENADVEGLRRVLRWDKDDPRWPLVKGWLPASLLADSPRPYLALLGPQGSAKTSTGRFITDVIEPKPQGTLGGAFGKPEDEVVKALGSYLPSWDNISRLSEDDSDFFSRLVTGEKFEKRRLYSDTDLVEISIQRTGVITGITLPKGIKSDALDRLVPINMPPVEDARVSESTLEAEWVDAHARILAGVLDLAVDMLAGEWTSPRDVRMQDYAEALHAIDPELHHAYADNYAEAKKDMAQHDPFVQALLAWLAAEAEDGHWDGTAEEALVEARAYKGLDQWWPNNGRGFSDAVTKAHVLLQEAGVQVTDLGRGNQGRLKRFELTEDFNAKPPVEDGPAEEDDGEPY